jgi:hypothetical protein
MTIKESYVASGLRARRESCVASSLLRRRCPGLRARREAVSGTPSGGGAYRA